MVRLYDLTSILRSKNAGPFTLTIDLMFNSPDDYNRVLTSPHFTPETIAKLYDVAPASIQIHPFPSIHTIKVTLPRPTSSGAPTNPDTYGSQQHFPIGDLVV